MTPRSLTSLLLAGLAVLCCGGLSGCSSVAKGVDLVKRIDLAKPFGFVKHFGRAKQFDPRGVAEATSADLVKTGKASALDPSMLKPPTAPFKLGPGDVVDIELLGSGDGPQRVFVGPDGKIYFHLLPGQQVWGLTIPQLRDQLENKLADFVKNPEITITLREVHSRRVWVLGRVNTPGLYELNQPMTVLEAITKAGGLFTSRMSGSTEELADLHQSFLIRKGNLVPVNFNRLIRDGDTSQNVYLEPDDFIYLPSALGSQVYVMGAINQPRAVAFKDEVTMITAIAHCRGLADGAIPEKVAIVRGSLTDPSIAVINLNEILTGRKPDVRLRPRDMIYVPRKMPGSLGSYADLIISTFARTVSANEGARAGGAVTPLDVNIGVGN